MDFKTYTRKPFIVEAVEITEANIEEIAALIGTVRTRDGVKSIILDKKVVPSISQAHIGWYVTRMGDKYRCYAPTLFHEQFSMAAMGDFGRLTAVDFGEKYIADI